MNLLDRRSGHQGHRRSREGRDCRLFRQPASMSQLRRAPDLIRQCLDKNSQLYTVYKLLHLRPKLHLPHRLSGPRWLQRTANQLGSPCTTRHRPLNMRRLDTAGALPRAGDSRNQLGTAYTQWQAAQSRYQPYTPPAHQWPSRTIFLQGKECSSAVLQSLRNTQKRSCCSPHCSERQYCPQMCLVGTLLAVQLRRCSCGTGPQALFSVLVGTSKEGAG